MAYLKPALALKLVPTLIIALSLSACGSGSSGSSSSGDSASTTKPAAPSLKSINTEGIANFRFTWDAVSNVSHYQLFVNPDGSSGFTEIGDKIDSSLTSFDLSVPLYDQANAQYILAACNAAGCSDSATMFPPGASALNAAVGYIKGDTPFREARFGYSVSLSDDGSCMAVAAHEQNRFGATNAGGVYVFVKDGATWSQEQVLLADFPNDDDKFGVSVSLSSDGSTLAVGAFNEDSGMEGINVDDAETFNNAFNRGAVYIYTRSGSTWSQQAFVKPTISNASTQNNRGIFQITGFGKSVSLSDDGNILAVGAPESTIASRTASGAAYIFSRSGSTWTEQVILSPSTWFNYDIFGDSISVSGDGRTVAIGAPQKTGIDAFGDSVTNAGVVYVFTESAGQWTEEKEIYASDVAQNSKFSISVSLSETGDALAVGAFGENSATPGVLTKGSDDPQNFGTKSGSGAVYMFERNGTTWSEDAFIKADVVDNHDEFGVSVSLSNDGLYLAIGARNEDSNATLFNGDGSIFGASNSGAAYVFRKDNGSWSQTVYVKATNTGDGDSFGTSVSINNRGTLLVGAPTEDSPATTVGGDQGDDPALGGAGNTGAAYLY